MTWTPHCSLTIQQSLTVNGHSEVFFWLLAPTFLVHTTLFMSVFTMHSCKWNCWVRFQSFTNHAVTAYYVLDTGEPGYRTDKCPCTQKPSFVGISPLNRCCHDAVHRWHRRRKAYSLASSHHSLGQLCRRGLDAYTFSAFKVSRIWWRDWSSGCTGGQGGRERLGRACSLVLGGGGRWESEST